MGAKPREVVKDGANVTKLKCRILRFVNVVVNAKGRIKLSDIMTRLTLNGFFIIAFETVDFKKELKIRLNEIRDTINIAILL